MASIRDRIAAKLNRDMQNLPTDLTDAQQGTVRTRIGIIGSVIKSLIEALTGTDRVDYSAIQNGPPDTAEQNVNADWDATTGDAAIANKPTDGELVPSGGATAQALLKASAADGDTEWGNVSAGDGAASEQRAETVALQGVSTTIAGQGISAAVNVAAASPISVKYGTGAAEMLSIPTAGGSEINIENAGIFLVKFLARVDVSLERPIPALAIYANSAVIGTDGPLEVIPSSYLRDVTNDHIVYGQRSIEIAAADTSIKLAWTSVGNGIGTPEFTVDTGAVVTFSRIGVKGDVGPPGAGEENVQSDWDETDTADDAFIENKPTIPTLRTAAATYTLIQSLLDYGDLSNQPTIPSLRTAAQTYALIQSLLDYEDLQNKPDLTQTTELFNGNVNVTTVEEFVAVGENIPAVAAADWILVQVQPEEDWIPINLAQLRAKNASTAGGTSASANRLKVHSPDLFETLYFGRTTADGILFSAGDAEGDGTPFDPSPLIIHTVDKVA